MAKPKKKFTREVKALIIALYEAGKTDKEVAGVLNTPYTTFKDRCEYNGLTDTIKIAKEIKNKEVEKTLLKRALGYEYKKIKRKGQVTAEGDPLGVYEVTEEMIKVEPSPVCIFFWLTNRVPEKWKHRQTLEGSLETNFKFDLKELQKHLKDDSDSEQ